MNILIVRIKGLGNMIMFTPALQALKKRYPDGKLTLLCDKLCGEVVRDSGLVDEIVYFDLNASAIKKLKVLLKLRKRKFDYSLMTFTGHRWEFNLLSFLIGAKKRVTHGYGAANLRTLAFLQNVKVPAVEGIHDVEQNIRLLKPFNITKVKEEQYFHIEKENRDFAEEYFKKNNLKSVIAIHSCGLGEEAFKRWPVEHFTKVIRMLQKNFDILMIAGPGEEGIVEEIRDPLEKKPLVLKDVPIRHTAAILEKCKALLCTDSGIGHLAAAVKTQVLSLVGPGDANRIGPYKGEVITRKTDCSPCIHYPFRNTNSDYAKAVCKELHCLTKISPEEVREKVLSMF